ncbi:MAG: hypothetical protein QOJ26_1308 [Thermoplasmata archaeon]|nr:hypothetical protein [Thermoplasmata archaeon]MEA3166436.1 hypothetical protein [Thermoplasmata archaeon]
MRLLLAIVLLASLFAGCSDGGDKPAPPAAATPAGFPRDLVIDITGNRTGGVAPGLEGPMSVVLHKVGKNGGEPNIGITSDGSVFVTSGGLTMRSQDHGASWTEVFNLTAFWGPLYDPEALPNSWPVPVCGTVPSLPLVGCPQPDQVRGLTRSSDPMLWVDTDTDRVFTDHMTGLYCSKLFFSDDIGESWVPSPVDCGVPVNDHQKIATARYGPAAAPPTDGIYPNVVYYCYNKLVSTNCAVSLNGGLSFQYDRPVTIANTNDEAQPSLMSECGGINGHPAPHPDGTMFVPMTLGCSAPNVGVSEDNGLTWAVRAGPTDHGANEIDPDITVTPDGTAYMLYRGDDEIQYLVRSPDKFRTWEGPWRVTPYGVNSTVFAGITSQEDGRIAMAFLGTRDWTGDPSEAANETRWHLWTVFSYDAAAQEPHFRAIQVTPEEEPVQIGCVWLGGGGNPCRNMLDFIDMASDRDGRPMVVFTDGCYLECDGNVSATNNNSRSRAVTVAVLEEGPSLVAANKFVAGDVVKSG